MRTKEELQAALDTVEADERLHYAPASGFANWPLVAIQASLKARANTLRFALGLGERNYYGEDEDSSKCGGT